MISKWCNRSHGRSIRLLAVTRSHRLLGGGAFTIDGQPLTLFRHQSQAIAKAKERQSFVVTTGTGSGKSLCFFIPIIDSAIRGRAAGESSRTRAIIVYPMNALANSQMSELEKFIDQAGLPENLRPTFARYTGQENQDERDLIRHSKPDILLTNFMMLELLMTRQSERDQQVISNAEGLDYIVLDELHTYRGRQGADVAMLVRRLRDRLCRDKYPICIGTSATMASEGGFDAKAAAVAGVASRLFGTPIPCDAVIDESLNRATDPNTVVSLDYIKAEKRRESFARACPQFVIVDEAHACVGTHMGRQQRFELLKRLAENEQRHLLLLTATPHSGDEDAFDRLLGLVNPEFSRGSLEDEAGRRRLARHFVQRRRIDITGREWGEERSFPKHLSREEIYRFNGDHQAFHDAVLDYCLGVVEGAGEDQQSRRLAFWSTLALMRCVGSSPAAALSALRTRLNDVDVLEEQLCDEDEADGLDVEPASIVADDAQLRALVQQAERLTRSADPKLDAIVALFRPILAEKSHPILFCRFIATAEHVAAGLRKAFPKLRVDVVTGLLTPEDRRARVESMVEAEQRILVATDCLSEGINLQHLFDSVIHYDLSWNPTRHQQREGRVDRFGQPAKVVRSVLLYSPDSAIDGAVLEVILRKAEATWSDIPFPCNHVAHLTPSCRSFSFLRNKVHNRL